MIPDKLFDNDKETRTENLYLRLTQSEKEFLKSEADKRNTTISDMIRACIKFTYTHSKIK